MSPAPSGAPASTFGNSRVAFFGGSFDPPHLGHVAVACAARQALSLDRVLFAPVGLQPLKPAGSSASFEDRAAMTRLAIANQPGFEISLADAPKPGTSASSFTRPNFTPNFTFDTLTAIRESLPKETTLFMLLGADSFLAFRHWHRAAELPFLAGLIVAARPHENLDDLSAGLPDGISLEAGAGQPNQYRLTNAEGEHSSLTILPDLHYDISATQLRSQVHGQAPNQAPLLDPAVLGYIREHHLYQE